MADADSLTPLLIFVHIPKAGGTSFNRVIGRQFPADAIIQNDRRLARVDLDALRALPEERKRAVRLLQGHMGYGAHELFPQPARYVTFVRDPVARIVSHYRHVLRHSHHYLHDQVAGRGLSLLEYSNSDLSAELENGQMRLLAGLEDEQVESSRENLELAKQHVREHFVLAGITERFDESLLLIKHALGWSNITYARENVAPSKGEPVDPATLAAIRERNALDVELYDFCQALLDERLAAEGGPSFERELKVLRARNAVRGVTARSERLLRSKARAVLRR